MNFFLYENRDIFIKNIIQVQGYVDKDIRQRSRRDLLDAILHIR